VGSHEKEIEVPKYDFEAMLEAALKEGGEGSSIPLQDIE